MLASCRRMAPLQRLFVFDHGLVDVKTGGRGAHYDSAVVHGCLVPSHQLSEIFHRLPN
jgi:hypothetical protein